MLENGQVSPIFHFCRSSTKPENLSSRHSADLSHLRIPNSKSSHASLSSVLEDSTLKRAQPPNSLSISSKAFQDHQMLRFYSKMASVESIGACSLDFEASAADNYAGKDLTASECTLHSNGVMPSVHEMARNGDISNGTRESLDKLGSICKRECSTAEIKLPSYVSISCAINGYPSYSRFCRSRDNSPARASFRKSSLEPSMLADMNRKESYESHRYSRSQSDCNGTMFTESKRVTVSKQIQIPLKSSKQYTTEVTLNGPGAKSDRTVASDSSTNKVVTNGHGGESLVLAKEVGSDGTKSLVQQRIESLYGKSVSEEIKVHSKIVSKGKDVHTNGVDGSTVSESPNENGHTGSVSPPVFRHLNKDFRKQLQINIPKRFDSDKPPLKPIKKVQLNQESHRNGSTPPVMNGNDECDRIKSMTPPPIKSTIFENDKKEIAPSHDSEREGYKYLNLIDVEKERIVEQVKRLEEELAVDPDLPDEASGRIRAACGKANLLITQKFEQFKGLCWKNIEENPSVPFYTTASDLAGFWDLVLLQVHDIHSTFKEIEDMKNNDWKEVVCDKPALPQTKIRHSNLNVVSRSNPSTPKRSAKSVELSKAREDARKQLLAAKKKGRQQASTKDEEDIAIFTPATNC